MSMRVDASLAHTILQRWDREETRELIGDMSRELVRATDGGKFGRNEYAMDLGYSIAASVRDPIFWAKLEMLLGYRFDC